MDAYRQNLIPTRSPRWPERMALACVLLALLSAGMWLLREHPLDEVPHSREAQAYAAGQAAAREEMAASVAAAYAQGRADARREAGAER